MSLLILVNGPAGSGKSRIAKYIAEKYDFEWINVDSLKQTYINIESGFNRKSDLPIIFTNIKQNIINHSLHHQSIVIDESFRDTAIEFINFAEKNNIKWLEIYLDCPLEVCLARCKNRGNSEREFSEEKVNSTWNLLNSYSNSTEHKIKHVNAGNSFDKVCSEIDKIIINTLSIHN